MSERAAVILGRCISGGFWLFILLAFIPAAILALPLVFLGCIFSPREW